MEFKFPDVGEGIHEGKLVAWKVKEGDSVHEDQVLAEVETDKAVVEIPSPTAGTVQTLHHQEGEVLKVGDPLVTFGDGAAAKTPAHEQEKPASMQVKDEDHDRAPERGTSKVESSLTPKAPKPHEIEPEHKAPPKQAVATHEATPSDDVKTAQGPITAMPGKVLATPSTRRLARELGVDISSVSGTGPSGRVTKQDVEGAAGKAPSTPPQPATAKPVQAAPASDTPKAAAQSPTPSAPAPTLTPGQTIPYTGIRKAIGDHMDQANAVPDVTEFATVDVTDLVELREQLKPRAEKQQVKLTFLAFFAKAACAALAKHPTLNAHFSPEGIATFPQVHLGFAVDTPKGLFVPVVQDAQAKSILALAKEIDRVASAARDGSLKPAEMKGSTFSITSIGPQRVEGFTPRLNTPEVAILGIGAIRDTPLVHNNEIKIRKAVTLSLTFDHRALDGAEAARFMTTLALFLEDPQILFLEGA